MHRDAVVTGHVAGQATPAAAGFHHGHARPQPQLATHVFQFGQLGLLQGQVGLLVVGAGVLHGGLVQPQAVEVVTQVVVVMDVFLGFVDAGGAGVVVFPQGIQPAGPALPGLVDGPVQGFHEVGQVALHRQSPGAVQVAEGQVGVGDQSVERLGVLQVQGKPGFLALGGDLCPVPQPEPDRRRPGHSHQLADHPALVTVRVPVHVTVGHGQGQHVPLAAVVGRSGLAGGTFGHGGHSPLRGFPVIVHSV